MADYLNERRADTLQRTKKLQSQLTEAAKLAEKKACVYVTGSFGRVEAGSHSDLDLFVVSRSVEESSDGSNPKKTKSALRRLDEICIKADLIEANDRLQFEPFSGDGEYLVHYAIDDLTKTLGRPDDDARNTFTARLLLLLESKPLIGDNVYHDLIALVIAEYWDEFEEHKNDFVPGFLINDILRLWRTFCVNYEARTQKEPDSKKAKRKLKNYKLKHSRLLTCYSAISYLLAVYADKRTVTPADAEAMVALTPTERLETLHSRFGVQKDLIVDILSSYEKFLKNTNYREDELLKAFMDSSYTNQLVVEANQFGDQVAFLLNGIGKGSRLHRLLIV